MNRAARRASCARERRAGGLVDLDRLLQFAFDTVACAGEPPPTTEELVLLASVLGTRSAEAMFSPLMVLERAVPGIGGVRLTVCREDDVRASLPLLNVPAEDDFRALVQEPTLGSILVVAWGDDGSFKYELLSWVRRAVDRASLDSWRRIFPGVTSAGGCA